MKKKLLLTCLIAQSTLAICYAGNMGPIQSEPNQNYNYFVSAEGLYAWKTIDVFYQNGTPVYPKLNSWGSRVAGGIIKPYKNNIAFSAEVGWGYYGKASFVNGLVGWDRKVSFYAFDLLVGPQYTYKKFDIFLKMGAFFENLKFVTTQNLANQIPGNVVAGIYSTTSSATTVVPEVKVGGIYNINDSFGISLAYMYVAGGKFHGNIYQVTQLGSSITSGFSNIQPPALNGVTFGLIYKF